jgi:hypothetical protein
MGGSAGATEGTCLNHVALRVGWRFSFVKVYDDSLDKGAEFALCAVDTIVAGLASIDRLMLTHIKQATLYTQHPSRYSASRIKIYVWVGLLSLPWLVVSGVGDEDA